MIKPAGPQGSGRLTLGILPSKSCGFVPGQLKGVFGASELVDAPLLDRWDETDQAIPKRRPLYSPPNR